MTRRNALGLLACVAAIAGLATGCGGSDKAGGDATDDPHTVLTLANPGDALDLGSYFEAIDQASAGSIELEVKRDWRAGEIDAETQTIDDVRSGRVDMASIAARAFDLRGVKAFEPLVAPLQVDTFELEREVLASPTADRMLDSVDELGLVGVALLPGPMRRPLGVSGSFLDAADFRGARFGVGPSAIARKSIEALGGEPVDTTVGVDVAAFDGVEAEAINIDGLRYDQAGRTLTANVNLWPRPFVIVVNRDTYDDLTDDQRAALRDAGDAALDPGIATQRDDLEPEAVSNVCARGGLSLRTASPGQLDGLRAAVEPVIRELEQDPETRDSQREIEAMVADATPESPPRCTASSDQPPTSEASTEPSPLDGVWVMDSTPRDLARILDTNINNPDIVPENWGHQTYVLDRGRFAFTEENDRACTWGYGAYSVAGQTLTLDFDGGGGRAPNNAINRPGEHFLFSWSLYRDQLTLGPVKGEVSPGNFSVNPWRRVDAAPSRDALSHSCPPPAQALDHG